MIILCIESRCPQETQNRMLLFGSSPQTRSPFWLLIPASEHKHTCLLFRLSWSWTLMLLTDAYRKPLTSVTAVLLRFLT
jgi:hypothetical protein